MAGERSKGGWLADLHAVLPSGQGTERNAYAAPLSPLPPSFPPSFHLSRLVSPAHYRSSGFPCHINNRQAITRPLPLLGLSLEAEASPRALQGGGEWEGGECREVCGAWTTGEAQSPINTSWQDQIGQGCKEVMPTGNRIPLKRFSFISLPLLQYHRPSFPFFSSSPTSAYNTVSFLFSPFFSPACDHPLKISMKYSLELDVRFSINVKYSCYFKNIEHFPPGSVVLKCAWEVFPLHRIKLSTQAVQIFSIPQFRFVKTHPYVWFESHWY